MKKYLLFILFVAPLAAYAAPKKHPEANIENRPAPRGADAPLVLTSDKPNFCITGSQSGKAFHSEAAFNSIVWKTDVVYIGDTHDQPQDHAAQLKALMAMRIARGSKIAVAFEMLNQDLQPVLDAYAAGKMTEEEFLAKTDWDKEWNFSFGMYKPLFDFAIANGLRAIALKVPKNIIDKIAVSGLESLTPEEKRYLPEKVELKQHPRYNEYLKTAFASLIDSPGARFLTLDKYLAAMTAANEGMAGRITTFLADNPGYAVLVIAGNNRIIYNAAVPASVKARSKEARQATFYTQNATSCPQTMPKEHKDMANYIWYINHTPKPAPAATPQPAVPASPVLSTAPLPSPAPAAAPGR